MQKACWLSRKRKSAKEKPVSWLCSRGQPHDQPTSHSACGFRSGVERAPELRSGAPAREGRVKSRARRSRRPSPEEVEQVSLNAFTRFGDVFTAPVGSCPPRERQGVVLVDGDIDRPGRVCNEVWPIRSHEFSLET